MKTITTIYQGLQKDRSPVQISLINTRVLLETGVNLRSVTKEQDSDPTTLAKVTAVLREMGMAA